MTVYIEKAVSVSGDLDIPAQFSRELRRADEFIKYAIVAANTAFEKDTDQHDHQVENCGLFLGSSYGPMETNFDVLWQVINKEQTSPTLFSHSVFNAAAGYLARIFQLHGSALTITEFGFPFFSALQQAITSIECGQISNCLVLQVETYSLLLDDARDKFGKTGSASQSTQWQPGACAWLISNKRTNKQSQRIDNLSLKTSSVSPEYYLNLQDHIYINEKKLSLASPLDAAIEISRALNNKAGTKYSFSLTAPYGEMILTTSL